MFRVVSLLTDTGKEIDSGFLEDSKEALILKPCEKVVIMPNGDRIGFCKPYPNKGGLIIRVSRS
jgi:hypothetical protein